MESPIEKLKQCIHEIEDPEEPDGHQDSLVKPVNGYMKVLDDICRQCPEFDPIGDGEEWWFQLRTKYGTLDLPAQKLSPEAKRAAESAGEERRRKSKGKYRAESRSDA